MFPLTAHVESIARLERASSPCKSEGYPLHVEYILTDRGTKLLDAVLIMQDIGVAYMIEHGQRELLERKGIVFSASIPTKK